MFKLNLFISKLNISTSADMIGTKIDNDFKCNNVIWAISFKLSEYVKLILKSSVAFVRSGRHCRLAFAEDNIFSCPNLSF